MALFMKKNPTIKVETSTAVYDGGKLYGLPLGQTSVVMLYDPKVWKESGAEPPRLCWTWDDYFEAAKKITEHTGGAMSGATDFGREESWFKIWLSQQDKSLNTADGKLNYTEQDVAAFWTLATKFREAKAGTPAEVTAVDPAGSPLVCKLSASEFQPDSAIGDKAWETYGREMALAPLPQVGAELGLYAEPPMILSVYDRAKNRDAALKLADFLVNDPEAGKILGMARGLPANLRTRVAITPGLSGPWKQVHAYEESISSQVKLGPPAPPKGASANFLLFNKPYEDVMYGKSTPEDAARRYYAEAQQNLAG
uniref:ABC transporter substrate-binding protein n=1 Tax=Nonomuraea pusilla TaxID=46177 RepID=UPI0006E22C9E